jgi:hypothetical protein
VKIVAEGSSDHNPEADEVLKKNGIFLISFLQYRRRDISPISVSRMITISIGA